MGFFDTFEDSAGGNWVASNEKRELALDGTPLPVVSVTERAGGQFGDEYVLNTTIDGEERSMSFTKGSVQSRDALLGQLKEYLASADAEPVTLKLTKLKQMYLLSNYEAE